jgi:hypothetical protein
MMPVAAVAYPFQPNAPDRRRVDYSSVSLSRPAARTFGIADPVDFIVLDNLATCPWLNPVAKI